LINYYYSRNGSSAKRRMPFGNPLANALVVVVGTLAIVTFLVVGFFAFVVLAVLALVLGAIIGIRIWWFNRRIRRDAAGRRSRSAGPDDVRARIIEGEYRDVSDDPGRRRR